MISQINIELTSWCDKSCYFCGHQNPKVNPNLRKGDISLDLLRDIANQLPLDPYLVVQFHRDGEPLLYPELNKALAMFSTHIVSVVTNGKKLAERWDDLLFADVITVSAFHGDPEGGDQDLAISAFLGLLSGEEVRPRLMVKVVGEIEPEREELWRKLGVEVIHRRLHVPHDSRDYRKGLPPIPEHGICLDLLHHPSIDWEGNVYLCNRLDIDGRRKLGNLADASLATILSWRDPVIEMHRQGKRGECAPCRGCEFYGIPAT